MSTTATPEQHIPPCLGQYVTEQTGDAREVVTLSRPDGSAFVVDRLAQSTEDSRVVAHLEASEPAENASIIAEMYLADDRKGHCALLSTEDLARTRNASSRTGSAIGVLRRSLLLDGEGYCYCLRELEIDSVSELRWTRSRLHGGEEDPAEPVTLRDLTGCLQNYEPARKLTREALTAYHQHTTCSTVMLRSELKRLETSPIILNRRLREVLVAAVKHRGMTMSEIALRCGHIKRDRAGRVGGEASWLARRIGQSPEAGKQCPSPWIHSDLLALIAREGINVCPREVEL